ncbi:hypothetical protein SAMN04515666_11937 [Bosea lupini]|uniref:Uncharacterized protein n=1 Tax=Bosea lupini TaxID=1036779 RepID=A0A1H8AEV0_9HYPH|nr:hypothetical protein [Bosea lupini]SEM69372.1 hypothetical protein SAMN04515666_11937 [Bosea lupini]
MTTFETASVVFSTIAMITALYGIMSAFAAKRSAHAAEKQAKHAETQAEAAVTQADAARAQARAAERQVDLMRSSVVFDRIGTTLKVRRAVIESKDILSVAHRAALDASGSKAIHQAIRPIRQIAGALEDFPPILPDSVRAMLFGYVQDLNAVDYMAATGDNGFALTSFHQQADMVTAAIDVAITDMIKDLGS